MALRKTIFLISIALVSCTSDYGNRVEGDNFTIYFPNPDDEGMAAQVARYWKDHGLLTGEKQDIQLLSKEGDYQLLLIAEDKDKMKVMPIEEQMLLSELQKDLQKELGNDNAFFEIVICNAQFEPIFNMNQ